MVKSWVFVFGFVALSLFAGSLGHSAKFVSDETWYGTTHVVQAPEYAQFAFLGDKLFVSPSDYTVVNLSTGELEKTTIAVSSTSKTFKGSDGSDLTWIIGYDQPGTDHTHFAKALLVDQDFKVLKEYPTLPQSLNPVSRWSIVSSSEDSFMVYNEDTFLIVSPKNVLHTDKDADEIGYTQYGMLSLYNATCYNATALSDGKFAFIVQGSPDTITLYAEFDNLLTVPTMFIMPGDLFVHSVFSVDGKPYVVGSSTQQAFLGSVTIQGNESVELKVRAFNVPDAYYFSIGMTECGDRLVVTSDEYLFSFTKEFELDWGKTVTVNLLNPVVQEGGCDYKTGNLYTVIAEDKNNFLGVLKMDGGSKAGFGSKNTQIEIKDLPLPKITHSSAKSGVYVQGSPYNPVFELASTELLQQNNIKSLTFTPLDKHLEDGADLPATPNSYFGFLPDNNIA